MWNVQVPPSGHGMMSVQQGKEPGQEENVPQGAGTNDAVVVDVVVVVVVVLGVTQPPAPQASQQLGTAPTHALPPDGVVHFAACRFVLHRVAPLALVRQQVTAPGLPQVERAVHRLTVPLHCMGSSPAATRALATAAAHAT
jgi:hypothetical protein